MSQIQELILTLSVSERLKLISFIASSISETEVVTVPDEWIKEAQIRNEEYKSGDSPGQTWDEVKARIHIG